MSSSSKARPAWATPLAAVRSPAAAPPRPTLPDRSPTAERSESGAPGRGHRKNAGKTWKNLGKTWGKPGENLEKPRKHLEKCREHVEKQWKNLGKSRKMM